MGMLVLLKTLGVMLPDQNASAPAFPCVPMTMRSAFISSAVFAIVSEGSPRATSAEIGTPSDVFSDVSPLR